MVHPGHICGLYYIPVPAPNAWTAPKRKYLPQVASSIHTRIISFSSRTTLKQTFVNPSKKETIAELRYTFPLYDGVSVVGFVCTVNKDRVIRGVVQERQEAKKTYDAAVAKGQTAGLLEQLPSASDVFTTTLGNIPAGAEIAVEITYLGELKHDAEVDGIRFTIPTSIAPRYGNYPGELAKASAIDVKSGIQIVVDAEMPNGSGIKSIQSPSHPISVTIGNTSTSPANAELSLQKASATLSLGTAELGQDFILQVVATNTSNPVAMLETHPTLPNQRALMATLVPKFNLPSSRPEVVFVCDRSGSMGSGGKIPNLKAALHIFLKSLPLGVKFNICSFGSHHEFLFDRSRAYDESSLAEATRHIDSFSANFGGTEMLSPMKDAFDRRYSDMDLEVFLLTDGEIWDQVSLTTTINEYVAKSKGAIRVFTLGVGQDVSHALIESVARAGNGFSQSVAENEKMNNKVVRMLKAALSPHITDYTLEVKYGSEPHKDADDDFEIVEKVMDALNLKVADPEKDSVSEKATLVEKQPISLFDTSANPDVEMVDANQDKTANGKYSHVPAVTEPKLLQAPFIIPPLFSFSRTSVYLLLSPETTQKTPKSVVLRGTSAQGPLELEIPVNVLAEKGETIHQLAARKAVHELEEGRGWISHAKSAEDGKLLKEKHDGRFQDMVEREAVRLGVKFQVGGKWCSFVAVEKDAKPGEKPSRAADEDESIIDYSEDEECDMEEATSSNRFYMSDSSSSSSPTQLSAAPAAFKAAPRARRAALPERKEKAKASNGLHAMRATQMMHQPQLQQAQMAAPLPPPGGAYGGAMPRPTAVATMACSVAAPPPPGPMLFSAESSRQNAEFAAPMADQTTGFRAGRKSRSGLLSSIASAMPSFRASGAMPAAPVSAKAGPSGAVMKKARLSREDSVAQEPTMPKDSLDALVFLQTFTGAWAWSDGLLGVLGIDLAQAEAAARSKSMESDIGSEVLATALVLAFLEKTLLARKDEWEMLADKAKDWLEMEVQARGTTADGYIATARGFFGTN